MKLALLNTSIITTTGTFELKDITLTEAVMLAQVAHAENNILSAIGHESTAQIMTELLEIPVIVDRIQFAQELGQQALVFKLNGRAPEGKILTEDEIQAIGFKFQLMTKLS